MVESSDVVEAYLKWWLECNAARQNGNVEIGGLILSAPKNVFSPEPSLTNSSALMLQEIGDVFRRKSTTDVIKNELDDSIQ